MVFTNVIA